MFFFYNSVKTLSIAALCTAIYLAVSLPCLAEKEPADLSPQWESIGPSLFFGKIGFFPENSFLRSELYMLRFNLAQHNLLLVEASSCLSKQKAHVKEIANKLKAVAGINANFFDPKGKPLGLILTAKNSINNKIQKGGQLLNGIFFVKNNIPGILNRTNFNSTGSSLAFQAGPIMHQAGRVVTFNSPSQTSRRSGIAITKTGEIVLFATLLRFPGASLEDIQKVLSRTGLEITDSLNLDGGSSSQFFIAPRATLEEISISGGDEVPTALLILEKSMPVNDSPQ